MSERDPNKHAHLMRVKARVDAYESLMASGLRGFRYSTYKASDGSGIGTYVFHDCQLTGVNAALTHLRDVARGYGLDDE